MQSLINKLQKRRDQLSELERQVFDYILRNPQKIGLMTADEVAGELFISTATVSRTAKHLGFRGFQELKYAIAQYDDVEKAEQHDLRIDHDIKTIMASIENQLHQTFRLLQKEPLDEVVTKLFHAEKIEIFGVGGSLPNCIEAARKLTFLGKNASARIDWDELQAVSKSLTKKDAAIIVSNSGETIHLMEYARNLMANKVPIIAIVGTKNSTLAKLADYPLQVMVEMVYFDQVDLSSRVSLTAVTDILMMKLAEKMG